MSKMLDRMSFQKKWEPKRRKKMMRRRDQREAMTSARTQRVDFVAVSSKGLRPSRLAVYGVAAVIAIFVALYIII